MAKRRFLSITLCLCLLFSVLSVGLVGSSFAETVNTYSDKVSLTFDGDAPYGIPVHRGVKVLAYENGYAKLQNNAKGGGTAYIGKDGTVGASPAYYKNDTAEVLAEAKSNLFMCEAGKTYRLKFDFKYLAGTGGITKKVTIWLHPDPTATSISDYDFSDRATLVESQAATMTIAETETVLTEDTEWATAYYIFTVKDDETDGVAIGFHPGYSSTYTSILAIDNLTVSEVGSLECNESRLHTMDDATNDAYIVGSGCNDGTALVDNYDEEHGSVLKLVGGNYARLGFEDLDVKQNRKNYVYFDAKAETDNAQPVMVLGVNGSGTKSCRFFFMGYQTPYDKGASFFVDGKQVTAANLKFSTEWQRYGIVIDTSNEELLAKITAYKADFWNKAIHFLFGVSGATAYFDNVQVIEVQTIAEAVPDEDTASPAVSIRTAKSAADNNGQYRSAGLRFRATVDNDIKATADEMGFIVAPSSAIKLDTDWYKFENGLNSIALTAVCYEKDGKDIVYEQGITQSAYQMILTGLTSEDGTVDYLMRRFTAVMYVKSGDTYTYYALGETSYKQVAAAYNVMNVDFDAPSNGAGLVTVSDEWKSHPQDYKLIAFTFDDGPKDTDGEDPTNNATRMINTLNKYAGAGTMFVIGNAINTRGVGQLEYAVSKGFEIASHTYTHQNINSTYLADRPDYTAQDYIDEQIKPLNDLLQEKMGITPKFLRASNGTCPQQVIDGAAAMNMPLVFGNQDEAGNTVATGDYKADTTADEVYNAIMSSMYDGKVILMHHTDCSAEALERLCPELYVDGYRFVTLSELFEYKLNLTDMSQVDVANSFGGSAGIYDVDDVKVKYCSSHLYESSITKYPRALDEGEKTYVCRWCKHTYTEILPKTNTLKVLAFGNSFAVDSMTYLWDIANDAGVENIVLGYINISACSLDTHWNNTIGNETIGYNKNTTGTVGRKTCTVAEMLADEEWDIISLQQNSANSAFPDTYGNLNNLVNYLTTNEPNARIVWHLTWSYKSTNSSDVFKEFDSDPVKMYNAIVSTYKEKVEPCELITSVTPSGTAVQNLRSSYLGETIYRDGLHMSYSHGRYLAALTWFAALTGGDVDSITWVPSDYPELADDLPVIRQSVKDAIKQPFAATQQATEK